jgi:hypothetical protein
VWWRKDDTSMSGCWEKHNNNNNKKALRIEQALSVEHGASKIVRWGMKRGWRRTGCCGHPISSHVVPPKCSYKMHFSHDLRMKRLARFSVCVCVVEFTSFLTDFLQDMQ